MPRWLLFTYWSRMMNSRWRLLLSHKMLIRKMQQRLQGPASALFAPIGKWWWSALGQLVFNIWSLDQLASLAPAWLPDQERFGENGESKKELLYIGQGWCCAQEQQIGLQWTCLLLGSRLALVQIANFSISGRALPLRQPQWQGIWIITWMLSMRKPIGLQLRCHPLGRKLVFLQFPTSALLLNQKVRWHLTAFLPFGDPCCSEFMKYVKTIVVIYTSMVAS